VPKLSSDVNEFKPLPGGNTFGSVDPSAAKRDVGAGGGYLVSWRADRILYENDGRD